MISRVEGQVFGIGSRIVADSASLDRRRKLQSPRSQEGTPCCCGLPSRALLLVVEDSATPPKHTDAPTTALPQGATMLAHRRLTLTALVSVSIRSDRLGSLSTLPPPICYNRATMTSPASEPITREESEPQLGPGPRNVTHSAPRQCSESRFNTHSRSLVDDRRNASELGLTLFRHRQLPCSFDRRGQALLKRLRWLGSVFVQQWSTRNPPLPASRAF